MIGLVSSHDDNGGHSSCSSSSNLPISCPESLLHTHGLRSIHDAIMIGGNTMVTDNPSLTNRHWKNNNNNNDDTIGGDKDQQRQPRPVVLDSSLKYLKQISESFKARNVIV